MGAWFREFRSEHGFTTYPDQETPVTVDVALVAVTYFCVLLSVATLLATLGIRGREKWSASLRACYAVAVGSIILVCLVGHGWQQGEVGITSSYLYRSNMPFQGTIGIRVGLQSANVSLDGYYLGPQGDKHVYFCEELKWADYGKEWERYSNCLQRGLPVPVLKVFEFLSVDEGGLRWARTFHSSGHFAHILLWTAFAFWLVCNLLLFSVVVYGAYMFFFTGLAMVIACIAYHVSQADQPLIVPFGDVDLRISYGWCYWLTLATGCVTLVLGLALIILDQFAHEGVAVFFQVEKLDHEEPIEQCEDKKSNPPSFSCVIDRRGTVVPPPLGSQMGDKRRASIFIDPGRRPTHYHDSLIRSLGLTPNNSQVFLTPGSAGFSNGVRSLSASRISPSHSMNKLMKISEDTPAVDSYSNRFINPLYSEAGPETKDKTSEAGTTKDPQRDAEIQHDTECVCQDSAVVVSTRKPSLDTLREHRENHANEQRCANENKQFDLSLKSSLLSLPVGQKRCVSNVSVTSKPSKTYRRSSSNESESSSEGGIIFYTSSTLSAGQSAATTPTNADKDSTFPDDQTTIQSFDAPQTISLSVPQIFKVDSENISGELNRSQSFSGEEISSDSGRGDSGSAGSASSSLHNSRGEDSLSKSAATGDSSILGSLSESRADVVVDIESSIL